MARSESDKKAEERRFAEQSNRILRWEVVDFGPHDQEAPDLRLTLSDGRVVGLEVARTTDQITASGEPAVDRLCAELVMRMRERDIAAGVSLLFVGGCSDLVARTDVRRQHVEGLLGLLDQPVGPEIRNVDATALEAAGAPYVERMSVYSAEVAQAGASFRRGGPDMPFVDEKIRQKDALIDAYRLKLRDAQEFWLLLVSHDCASNILDAVMTNHTYQTRFDAVFWLDVRDDTAFRLSTKPRDRTAD